MPVTKQPLQDLKPATQEPSPPAANCRTPGCGAAAAHAPAQAEAAPQAAGPATGPAAATRGPATPDPTTGGTAPATGTPAPTAPLTNDQRWTQIQATLQKGALGQQALQRKTAYGVGINWVPGTGSFYTASGNTMTLDTTETPQDAALTFVHEMNHAHYEHQRLGAHGSNNISTMTRQAYVGAMLDEEVEGTVMAIEAKLEVVAAGVTGAGSFPLEAQYMSAYQAAKSAGKSEAEAKAAGRLRVRKGFDDGEVVTSNTGAKYADYYGAAWDGAHPAGGGGW